MTITHIVNVSGGKDSAAVALLAKESGRNFDLWMADTGNEHPATVDYACKLAEFLGQQLNIARADFSNRIARKRAYVLEKWPEKGIPSAIIERADAALIPSGNPFLDLCLWKGRFPSRKAQFCTEFLKQDAMNGAAVMPALERGAVIQWLGVRRDESLNRRNAPRFSHIRQNGKRITLFRPIIHWTANNVFEFSKAMGLPPNPLYLQGFSRVGCFPCINASKGELAIIGKKYPEAIERLQQWESAVEAANARSSATFFAPGVTPEGEALSRYAKKEKLDSAEMAKLPWPRADQVFEWAKTSRGGRQFHMFDDMETGESCSSQYGLCE